MTTNFREYLPEIINDNLMYYVGQVRYSLQPYVSIEYTADKIVDNIYVGDIASISNKEELLKNNITHIVSVINGGKEIFPEDFKYKIIHINDDYWVDIKSHFDDSIKFIEDALKESKNNNVMIHCQRGVSRSVSIMVAYLLKKRNEKNKIKKEEVKEIVFKTIQDVKEKRKIAEPNEGFVKKLEEYVCDLNDYDYE
tara:strand:+ start:621 stop:1208 length:588 start_codon:yes stop_codon:yes gene_type:complete